MKIYLDTNIIYKYFDKLVEQVKKKEPLEKVVPTKKVAYLYSIRDRHEYFVSNLTKAEIFRYLHSALGVLPKDCFNLWKFFKEILNVKEFIIEKIDFDRITNMVAEEVAPKGILINLQHLLVAQENELTVLTGDKPLKERFVKFYDKVMSYIEFRKLPT